MTAAVQGVLKTLDTKSPQKALWLKLSKTRLVFVRKHKAHKTDEGPLTAGDNGNQINRTRKSSCVNVRGIPTAAYQVLPEVGYPPHQGTPPRGPAGGGYPRRGTPIRVPPWPGPMGGT